MEKPQTAKWNNMYLYSSVSKKIRVSPMHVSDSEYVAFFFLNFSYEYIIN